MSLRVRARLALASLLTVALGATFGGSAQAVGATPGSPGEGSEGERLTVMTQNLYLGSSLTPAITATTQAEFLAAVARIYDTAVKTNFPRRAEAIADTIAAEEPDLIGLQEVTRWIAQPLVPGPTPPSYDFLTILQAELAERGMHYEVGAVSDNADIGPAPLVAPTFGCRGPSSASWTPDCVVKLQDRDVILVNSHTPDLDVLAAHSGDYAAQQVLTPPGGGPVSFARGWAYVDASFEGVEFRFLTTHLEVEEFAAVQEAQAAEFLAGPAKTGGPVIATGDFNSAADPATTDTPTATYAALTKSWFRDAWWVNDGAPGLTCCQNETLSNTVSRLRTRIDLILTHGSVHTKSAHVVGDQPIATTGPPPYWASDHAGVVATLRLRGLGS